MAAPHRIVTAGFGMATRPPPYMPLPATGFAGYPQACLFTVRYTFTQTALACYTT